MFPVHLNKQTYFILFIRLNANALFTCHFNMWQAIRMISFGLKTFLFFWHNSMFRQT